ncbi:hypothetical protein VUR80DRAFT_7130 [Thermomyces stellatus]
MVGGIGSLLAQIEGGKPSNEPAQPVARTNVVPKRRADDQLRKEPAKTVRTGDKAASSPGIPSRPAPQPTSSDRPAPRTPAKPAATSKTNGATGAKPPSGPAKPSPSTNAAAASAQTPQKPLKKGSFAEIMARGQRAQETMGQVGKIQHKRLEVPAKKDKDEEAKADPRSAARKPGKSTSARETKDGKAADPKSKRKSPASDPEPKKKVRKPPPSTGYAGTARPRATPAASRTSRPASGGVVLNPQIRRPSRAREEDEDSLDDFIIDDEDEEHGGPRYGYNDGYESSDMEAGIDEIDDEEARAAAIAREDDLREEMEEKRRKEEKMRRKREGRW